MVIMKIICRSRRGVTEMPEPAASIELDFEIWLEGAENLSGEERV
jgi:hypothetical protein